MYLPTAPSSYPRQKISTSSARDLPHYNQKPSALSLLFTFFDISLSSSPAGIGDGRSLCFQTNYSRTSKTFASINIQYKQRQISNIKIK
jgi:hypothetical protein